MPRTHVNCTVNGDEVDFLSADETSLLNALRDELGLTGVKEGCGTGDCGACTILVDGKVNCACLMFAPEAEAEELIRWLDAAGVVAVEIGQARKRSGALLEVR